MLGPSTSWTPWVRRPRELSDAEARLLAVLLSPTLETEASRIRRSGIPRSTYQRLRRRLYADGWLRDRYVPRLDVLGQEALTFVLGFPYAEQAEEVEQAWARARRAVVVWSSGEVVFGVFVGDDPLRADPSRPLFPRSLRGRISVTARPDDGAVLRYFDYAPAWSSWSGFDTPSGPLAGWNVLGPGDGSGAKPIPHRTLRVARELVGPRATEERARRLPHMQGYTFLPRPGQEVVRRGLVHWQVTPDFRRIPAVGGRRPTDLVFVVAERRPAREPAHLLRELADRAGVYPFLAAFDRDRALLGILESGPVGDEAPEEAAPPPSGLVAILRHFLVGIEVFRGRLAHWREVVDHDYRRLLG